MADDLKSLATHEAGHAVMAMLMGQAVREIVLKDESSRVVATTYCVGDIDYSRRMLVGFAGGAAEAVIHGNAQYNCSSDFEIVGALAHRESLRKSFRRRYWKSEPPTSPRSEFQAHAEVCEQIVSRPIVRRAINRVAKYIHQSWIEGQRNVSGLEITLLARVYLDGENFSGA